MRSETNPTVSPVGHSTTLVQENLLEAYKINSYTYKSYLYSEGWLAN